MAAHASQAARASFVFATCQVGAEGALKAEVARKWPDFHFAFSRPGFLTFKLPADHALTPDFDPGLVFARSFGLSLGKARGLDLPVLAHECAKHAAAAMAEVLHLYERDKAPPGVRDFEPAITPMAISAREATLAAWPPAAHRPTLEHVAKMGQLVFDCVLVEPLEWWFGFHRAVSTSSCWPGGICEIEPAADMISRAYLKMEEAIRWSRLPIKAGERAVELGCSPGGASQALLKRKLNVVGIDPAEVDPRLLAYPNFQHVRKRAADIRRREYAGIPWLVADMNVAPDYMLDTVEAIVTHPSVHVTGMLLTLKLLDWSLADEIPAYLHRIRSWGYKRVTARQLSHNRQEVCVAAQRG